MEAIPCAMAQALYHDGACTCSTCANLCQKVGLQGRESFNIKSQKKLSPLEVLHDATAAAREKEAKSKK